MLQAVAAVVPAVVAAVGLARGPGSMRSRLRHDVQMLSELPPDSPAHKTLLAHVGDRIEHLAKFETEATRSWDSFVIALFISVGFGALALWLFTSDRWYWWLSGVPMAVIALATLTIMFEAAQRVPRDPKGKRL
jgi:hypothetical protein